MRRSAQCDSDANTEAQKEGIARFQQEIFSGAFDEVARRLAGGWGRGGSKMAQGNGLFALTEASVRPVLAF